MFTVDGATASVRVQHVGSVVEHVVGVGPRLLERCVALVPPLVKPED